MMQQLNAAKDKLGQDEDYSGEQLAEPVIVHDAQGQRSHACRVCGSGPSCGKQQQKPEQR
jgi:hypothetical protein